MVMACPKSARLRDWESNRQGVEGPWTLALAQKDTQRDIKIHKIPRDVTEHGEREADSQGTEEIIKRCKPFKHSRVIRC